MFVPLAHPIGDAVRWQRIAVPLQKTAPGRSSEVCQFSLVHEPQSAEAAVSFTNDTAVAAQSAPDASGIARWFGWQIKLGPRISMDRLYSRTRRAEARAQAVDADAQGS